ncbi:MAG: DinB family protein [Capsulimonadaceae bacterium]
MMHFPEFTRHYLLTGLAATPDVIEALLRDIQPDDPAWDFTADPERFTLRGIIAHVADFGDIFHERILRTRDEDAPVLANIDEGQLAIDHNYALRDPVAGLARFRAGRTALVETLTALQPEHWRRVAQRHFGPISILGQAVLVLGHDGYHTQQVAQWIEALNQ